MTRFFACLFLLMPVIGQPGTPAGKLSVDQAKKLLAKAASISNADFFALANDPDPLKIKNQSLSLVLWARVLRLADSEKRTNKNPVITEAFRVVGDGLANPARIADAMAISRTQGYVSLIQPEYITECTCESGEDLAEGTVAFCKEGVFQGKVRFVALKQKNEWVITEFHLGNDIVWVFLGQDDGLWHSALHAVSGKAPDPRPTDKEFENQLRRLESKDAKGARLQALTWLNRNRAAKNADLAIPALERIVREDPDAEVRLQAVPVLALIVNNLKKSCPRVIIEAFLDKDLQVRDQATACTGLFNSFAPDSVEVLLACAKAENPNVRSESLRILALAAATNPNALDAIEKGKLDPTFHVRHAAYCAKFQANGKLAEFVPYIIRVREDPEGALRPVSNDPEIRKQEQCMRTLFQMGCAIKLIAWSDERPNELAQVLGDLLEDKSPIIRRGAARLVGITATETVLRIPDESGTDPLAELEKELKEDSQSKRPPRKSKVAAQFEKLKVEERLRRLRDHDADESVREAARTSLQRLASLHE
jgi:HEAT repeat protein